MTACYPPVLLDAQQHMCGVAAIRDKTGPCSAVFLARLESWFNSRLDRVVMGMMSPRKRVQRFHVTTLLRFWNCGDVWLCVLGANRWFPAFGSWVGRVIYLRQVLPVQVGIDLGGGDVGVAEHLLDRTEIT